MGNIRSDKCKVENAPEALKKDSSEDERGILQSQEPVTSLQFLGAQQSVVCWNIPSKGRLSYFIVHLSGATRMPGRPLCCLLELPLIPFNWVMWEAATSEWGPGQESPPKQVQAVAKWPDTYSLGPCRPISIESWWWKKDAMWNLWTAQ